MAFTVGPLVSMLPALVISAILSFFLYQILSKDKPTYMLRFPVNVQKHTSREFSGWNLKSSAKNRDKILQNKTLFFPLKLDPDLHTMNITMEVVTLWILLTLGIDGLREASTFLPTFGSFIDYLMYGMLTVLLSTTLISSLAVNLSYDVIRKVAATAMAILASVDFFFLPSTVWIVKSDLSRLRRIVTIYVAAVFVAFEAYMFWWVIKPKRAFKISLYLSILDYLFIVSLMSFKIISAVI